MGKESITLSMELPKTQCYEFECFEDNFSLTISTQACRINTRKFNTEGTWSLQSFKTHHPQWRHGLIPQLRVSFYLRVTQVSRFKPSESHE